jgi:hypothetical protein
MLAFFWTSLIPARGAAMRRRDVLAGVGSLATGAALTFPAPAIAQGLRQLKMVTAWPAGSPGLQSSAERLAQRISTASDGRINIRVFPAGARFRLPITVGRMTAEHGKLRAEIVEPQPRIILSVQNIECADHQARCKRPRRRAL